MSIKVRCSLCSEVIKVSEKDVSNLINHIQGLHPEIFLKEPLGKAREISSKRKITNKDKRLYKRSIQNWNPGKGCIYCPRCAIKRKPFMVDDAGGCLMKCCCSGSKKYLHCPVCNAFLGLYDKGKCTVRPNVQFVLKGNDGDIKPKKCE